MTRIHEDEVEIDVALVSRLLGAQFPQWSSLPVTPIPSGGTDNAVFRLGDGMAVRMPRIHWAVEQVEKEQKWLPRLAPHLTLSIPVPLGMGKSDESYPYSWSVYRWLEGENATLERLKNPSQAARELAQFITALHKIDSADGPLPGSHNSSRGVPLRMRDETVRASIDALRGLIDTDAATMAWEEALQAPDWQNAPVWIHGDLQSGNLLAYQSQLSAVIDFGTLGVGDPACDLIVAWNLFSGQSRDAFREAFSADAATWARGRGWALSIGLIALPYYLNTSPAMVEYAQHVIAEVLADDERNS